MRMVRDTGAGRGLPQSERNRAVANDRNVETRVGRHIEPQPNGCWLYNGQTDRYGQVKGAHRGRRWSMPAHRFVYEVLVGRIPEGHHLHHECETPGCCNPEHLAPLTPGDHRRLHCGGGGVGPA